MLFFRGAIRLHVGNGIMVAGARNRFNLRTESRLIRFVKLVPRDERRGLFRAAA